MTGLNECPPQAQVHKPAGFTFQNKGDLILPQLQKPTRLSHRKHIWRLVRELGGMGQPGREINGFGDSAMNRSVSLFSKIQMKIQMVGLETKTLHSYSGGQFWLGPRIPIGWPRAQMCISLLWWLSWVLKIFWNRILQISKHLKGHSAPHVGHVTFLLKGHSGQPVGHVTFCWKIPCLLLCEN